MKQPVNNLLKGIRVAVPESRQLDTMVQLLERRGAGVMRVPLVSIHDAPDAGPVLAWIKAFCAAPPHLLIILTGEGIRRLLSLAERGGCKQDLINALGNTTKLCRGPKPERALREVGLKGDIQASVPTTDGVIATLQELDIEGQQVAVQLYGEDPNTRLMDYLAGRRAIVSSVAPYIYADDTEEAQVVELIQALAGASIDAVAFTSQPQVKRLFQVAASHNLEQELTEGLSKCCVAAVGPVVREHLESRGIRVDIMPRQAFFMKPLVTEILRHFSEKPGR